MRLLVTGGAGFIGSNFVRYILRTRPGYSILNLDKLTYAGNLENLSDVESNPHYRFHRGDICDVEAVEALLHEPVDGVVHFAAESHVDRSIADARDFIRTNIQGTHTLLDAARRARVPRFVHVSTDEVYGSLPSGKAAHEEWPLQPNSPYAASKAASDLLVRSFYQTYRFPAIIARASNNYGPRQFPEKLIPLMISNALEGRKLPVYGDGLNERDWVFVEDHCRAIDQVLHSGRPGEIYNIGFGRPVTNLEVVRSVLRILGKPEDMIEFVADRPGHDRRYALDTGKIERELGWRPEVDLEAGLVETVEWYCAHAEWIRKAKSGDYRAYYEKFYLNRSASLAQI
ncbi:MAG: dTDP-glucose 4,6-dehydratase [Acidobacteriia bacterium]|nr:dTDP-glucose 4,6-dehydratase [Terriglobia bacterium]